MSELDLLWRLRELDEALASVRARRSRFPEARARIERGVSEGRARVAAADEETKSLALEKRTAEREIETLTEQEKKFQLQLFQVKKNEEYTALQHEIAAVQARRSELETVVLERMDAEDAKAAAVARARAELAAAEAKAAEENATIAKEEAELEARDRELEGERAKLLPDLTPAHRGLYERVQRGKGNAVVALVRDSCAGCGTTLPLQVAMEIRRRTGVAQCPGCGRILVAPPVAGDTADLA